MKIISQRRKIPIIYFLIQVTIACASTVMADDSPPQSHHFLPSSPSSKMREWRKDFNKDGKTDFIQYDFKTRKSSHQPEKMRVLEDTDFDGKFDRETLFPFPSNSNSNSDSDFFREIY